MALRVEDRGRNDTGAGKEEINEHALRLADVRTHGAEQPLPGGGPAPDPDLARILAAWPELPPHYRAAMLALVEAARGPTTT